MNKITSVCEDQRLSKYTVMIQRVRAQLSAGRPVTEFTPRGRERVSGEVGIQHFTPAHVPSGRRVRGVEIWLSGIKP